MYCYRGVANFEKHCVEHDIDLDYDALTELYKMPTQLGLITDPKLRGLARAMIEQEVDGRYKEVYKECTNEARELAHTGLKDLLPGDMSSVAGAAGKVAKTVLPLPGFLK